MEALPYRINFQLRRMLADTPIGALARRLKPRAGWYRNAQWWDSALTGMHADYLGSLEVELRARMIATLIGRAERVLDVGCAGGALFKALPCLDYTGVDISAVATDQASKQYPAAKFCASDLCEFSPHELYDLIVFSEVLYYLEPDEACGEVWRYGTFLTPGTGRICISMKRDPKSFAILKRILKQFTCVQSVIYQHATGEVARRISIQQAEPAFIVSVFRAM